MNHISILTSMNANTLPYGARFLRSKAFHAKCGRWPASRAFPRLASGMLLAALGTALGQPVITTNYSASIPDHRTPVSGLYLANTTQIYPEDRGLNYSVRLGDRIAALVAGDNPSA
jgi:hypothetical protein